MLTKIRYMDYARFWIALSLVLTVAGLGAFFTVGLNKGIDFTGGLMIDIQYEHKVTSAQLADVVKKATGHDPLVQSAEVKGASTPDATEFIVRTPEIPAEKRDQLYKDLESLGKYKKISEELVSGTVSGELTTKAVMAVAIAAIFQAIYLWIRFQMKFGVTAVIALLHDVVITLGIVSLLRIQVNSPFVAAILTILGYSINDTVIVFDRIRENLRDRKKNESLKDLTTRSIQEVIGRSIFTVVNVQICIVALMIWGGDSVRDFATSLFIGITSGMYSSMFIAAAMWLFWQNWDDQKRKAGASNPKPAKA